MGYEKSKMVSKKTRKRKTQQAPAAGVEMVSTGDLHDSSRFDASTQPPIGVTIERVHEPDIDTDSRDNNNSARRGDGVSRPGSRESGIYSNTGRDASLDGLRPQPRGGQAVDVLEALGVSPEREHGNGGSRLGHQEPPEDRSRPGTELLSDELSNVNSPDTHSDFNPNTYRGLTDFIACMQEFFDEWAAIHSDCMDAKVDYPFEEWEMDFYDLANGFVKLRYKGLDTPPWREGD